METAIQSLVASASAVVDAVPIPPLLVEVMPIASQAVAWAAAIHSAVLVFMRAKTHESESFWIEIFGVLLDFMVLPVAYYFPHFGFNARWGIFPLVFSLFTLWSNYRVHVVGNSFKAKDMSGKVIVVTGANTGIGYYTAKHLLEMNATVILACRSKDRGIAARDALVAETGCDKKQVIFLPLDLCSFDSIRAFVKEFSGLGLPLHILINNAGVMLEKKQLLEDGYEMSFTANYLGPFLLTLLLLPALKKHKDGRIINLTSSLHWDCPRFDFDNVMSEKSYSLFSNYAQCKLGNILFSNELQRRLDLEGASSNGLTVNSVHPGLVLTEVTRNFNALVRFGYAVAMPIMKTLQKNASHGANCSVYAAVDESLEGVGGKYLVNCRIAPMGPGAKKMADAERLWDLSIKLTGLDKEAVASLGMGKDNKSSAPTTTAASAKEGEQSPKARVGARKKSPKAN